MIPKSVVGVEVEKKNNQKVVGIAVLFVGVTLACLVLSNSMPRSYVLSQIFAINSNGFAAKNKDPLDIVLEKASTKDKTVIITNLNDAWAEPHSIFDVFLESFRVGIDTKSLVKHLVVICLDEKAYNRCLALHPHCYRFQIEGFNFTREAFFMTPDYLEIVWRKIDLLATVLEKGYNFVFTDNDIMWLRNPFPRFFPDADIQVSCDTFLGNSTDLNNLANTGFSFVKSNNRTVQFYKFWYNSRKRFPRLHDQHVFDRIKYDPFITKDVGLQMRFHDTDIFGGFCHASKDFNLVCTMHANCCVGVERKVHDLQIVLGDWRRYKSLEPSMQPNVSWSIPQNCLLNNIFKYMEPS
ncbi:uncharacterized protein At4g15970 [Ziziphus jujuba]|uniref:Uncharacterized protein At4g15970 n=1 Tax=Ziziphus jujuba TaxID=326968 RepID=A0A6P4A6D6_ZIZJJ|nr:uncharacterized protein At4g15970 [Ziziphus jujuba]